MVTTLINVLICTGLILCMYLLYRLSKWILPLSKTTDEEETEQTQDWKDAHKKVEKKLDSAAEHFKSITMPSPDEVE